MVSAVGRSTHYHVLSLKRLVETLTAGSFSDGGVSFPAQSLVSLQLGMPDASLLWRSLFHKLGTKKLVRFLALLSGQSPE